MSKKQAVIDDLIDEIKHLQTYKLFEGDEQVLIDRDDAFNIFARFIRLFKPEVKPISYQDCQNALLKMWMDNVLTDGEYRKIVDKLNAIQENEKK